MKDKRLKIKAKRSKIKESKAVFNELSAQSLGQPIILENESKTPLEGVRGEVFLDRYAWRGEGGELKEEYPEQMWSRVSQAIAEVEGSEKLKNYWAEKFYWAMKDFKFVPGGRILSGAGVPHERTFYNCFVIPSPKDSREGILDNLKLMVDIFARGGGVGINISSLRPRGAVVKKVGGTSSGPVNWASLYSVASHDVIQQGGTRRGALMLMINDWHPDVVEFIEVKKDLSRVAGANLSVCISDVFMEAVKGDAIWQLRFPDISDPEYDKLWDGNLDKWASLGKKIISYGEVKAREIWDKIAHAAWSSAEPGVVFIERYNKQSNTHYFEKIISVNPCGEQGLPAWGVCNLGSINLNSFVREGKFDYDLLKEVTKVAIRFLDDVIDSTKYFFKENEQAQRSGSRRTGLGTLGLGDALLRMKLKYGAEESLKEIEKIYQTIRDAAYEESVELSKEKGPFPKYDKEKYLQSYFVRKLPPEIQKGIAKWGIRNAVLLTQAPTGSTSLLSGTSSGIEPIYDFAFKRRDRIGEHYLYHPEYQRWKNENPDRTLPSYFVTANDLTPEDHVVVQAKIQEYTDSSISKTVNAPNSHTVDDVKKLYQLAYELGCKGITYMRDGSRQGVLEHLDGDGVAHESVEKVVVPEPTEPAGESPTQPTLIEMPTPTKPAAAPLRIRPDLLKSVTYKAKTPMGNVYISITDDDKGDPFEVFTFVGKSGSDMMADAEAIGRLISLALRLPSHFTPKEVAAQIVDQLEGIGGRVSLGFGDGKVRSLADAIGKVLAKHIGINGKRNNNHVPKEEGESSKTEPEVLMKGKDFCPECKSATLVFEEGCAKCYSCGYSEC